jgi:2-polyprenyl-3-methyl-5-hydroxy-6-metoxy-1,4-benzoquinol methylase
MPLLSTLARRKKIAYFTPHLPKDARILEVGCGDGWLGRYLRAHGWAHYTGMDVQGPADVVGDVCRWRTLGLAAGSFDAVIAFEVVEHVWCFEEFHDLLRPGGLLMLTTPLPTMDWLCRLMEAMGLNQKRTSPHDHLINLRQVPLFEPVEIRIVPPCAQWGIFRKPRAAL